MPIAYILQDTCTEDRRPTAPPLMCCTASVQDGLSSVYSHLKLCAASLGSQMRKGADLAFAKTWCCGGQRHLLWPEQVRRWLVMLLQGYFNKVRNSSMGMQQFFGLTLSHTTAYKRDVLVYIRRQKGTLGEWSACLTEKS